MSNSCNVMVCGFAFAVDESGTTVVALVKKNRPEWQRGKFNGVGGEVESSMFNETHLNAMHREWGEETGSVERIDWDEFHVLSEREFNPSWVVHFFRGWTTIEWIRDIEARTKGWAEPIVAHRVNDLPDIQKLKNLSWLVPMALDSSIDRGSSFEQ